MTLTDNTSDDEFHSDYSALDGSRGSPTLLTSDDEALPLGFRKSHTALTVSSPRQHLSPLLQFGRRKQRRFENDFYFFNGMDSFWDANPLLHSLCEEFTQMTLQEQADENPFDQFKKQLPELFDRFIEGEVDVQVTARKPKNAMRNQSLAKVDRKIRHHLLNHCESHLVRGLESVLLQGNMISEFSCQQVVDEATGEVWLHFEFADPGERRIAMGVVQYYGVPFQCDRRGKVKILLRDLAIVQQQPTTTVLSRLKQL